MTPPDVETVSWMRLIAALIVTATLLGGLSYGLKYMAKRGFGNFGGQFGSSAGKSRRLQLVESLPIDVKRRLVIVRCDAEEHVLLLGNDSDLVLSSRPVSESNASSHSQS